MTTYSISCSTCGARLKVRDARAIGELSLCPKCGSMVMITPPSPDGDAAAPSRRHSAGGSSPQLIVGGGALGSDFADAAALLADTIDDAAPATFNAPGAQQAVAKSASSDSKQSALKQPSGEQPSGKQPAEKQPTAHQMTADQTTADQPTGNSPLPENGNGSQVVDAAANGLGRKDRGATTTKRRAAAAAVAAEAAELAPPPVEPPTESMSSIELEPSAAAESSPLAQAGAMEVGAGQNGTAQVGAGQNGTAQVGAEQAGAEQAGAGQAGAGQAGAGQAGAGQAAAVATAAPINSKQAAPATLDATAGAAMPPPVSQPAWSTPSQLAWQRYGLIGAASLAAIVLVGGLLMFILRGHKDDPRAENAARPASVDPIPDPEKSNAIDPHVVDDRNPAVDPPDSTPAADKSGSDSGVNDGEVDPPVDSHATEPVRPPKTSGGSDGPDTAAPPLFVDGGDGGPPDDASTSVPSPDTGLGDLAALIEPGPPPSAPTHPSAGGATDKPPPPAPSRPRPDPVSVNVEARLDDQIARIKTDGTPLLKFTREMMQFSTIPIAISPAAMAENRKVDPTTMIAVDLASSSVREILKQALAKHGLAYDVRDDRIVVVSAKSQRDTWSVPHAVGDLVANQEEAQALAERIQTLIAPQTWGLDGGAGRATAAADKITITNSYDVQFEIHVFLEKLRVARGLPPRSSYDPAMFATRSRTQRAAAKLDTPVRAVFHVERPLIQVLGHLEETAGVTFLVDWQALLEEGWPPHSTAAVVADGVPLREALDKLLGPMDLTYRAIDETTMQITSVNSLKTDGELELYPVADVLAAKKISPEQLIADLKKQLGAGLFVEGGGPFEILYDEPSQCLLVRLPQAQQRALHEQLVAWNSTSE